MTTTNKLTPWLAPLLGLAATSMALADDETRYADCMALGAEAPGRAIEQARAWRAEGGGALAHHCEAMALLGLGASRDAAGMLEELAFSLDGEAARMQIELLAQAGQAWLIAGNNERALSIQTLALDLAPNDADLLVDRAVTLADAGKYREAIADLDRADALAPDEPEILVYRATAQRYLDRLDLALADVERALELKPNAPAALLERGIVRRLSGDDEGARRDWLRVLALAPDDDVGELARANIERLDIEAP